MKASFFKKKSLENTTHDWSHLQMLREFFFLSKQEWKWWQALKPAATLPANCRMQSHTGEKQVITEWEYILYKKAAPSVLQAYWRIKVQRHHPCAVKSKDEYSKNKTAPLYFLVKWAVFPKSNGLEMAFTQVLQVHNKTDKSLQHLVAPQIPWILSSSESFWFLSLLTQAFKHNITPQETSLLEIHSVASKREAKNIYKQ